MKKYILIYIIISIQFVSCRKLIEVPPPKNQLLTDQVFADSTNATGAILGIYINMMPNFTSHITNGGLSIITGLTSDELYRSSSNTNENEYYNNSISVTNSLNSGLWRVAYSILYNINASIEGINNSNNLNISLKNRLISEAKFCRAFVYFNLVNLYGAVPLITSTSYQENRILPRTSIDSVYNLILDDLIFAQNNLDEIYITSGRFRPNKHTIDALLSKIYLFRKDWINAEKFASRIISSNQYQIESNLNDVFLSGSKEAIWKLQVQYTTIETWNGYYFNPTASLSSRPTYLLTTDLLDAFELGDKRFENGNWVNQKIVGNVKYTYPYKYKIRNVENDRREEEFIIFRLAELYLIRAEARVQQNNSIGAIEDLNIIRMRAGLTLLNTDLTQSELIFAIEQERRTELFSEWGNRWYDLKRWNKTSEILGPLKNDWQTTDEFFPIPKTELDKNPQLIQNPGY